MRRNGLYFSPLNSPILTVPCQVVCGSGACVGVWGGWGGMRVECEVDRQAVQAAGGAHSGVEKGPVFPFFFPFSCSGIMPAVSCL